jgi:hypothetical protein
MTQVADLPASDRSDEEEEEDEEEEDEEEDEEESEDEEDAEVAAAGPSAPVDPEEAAAQLEHLRLHKALGNDGAPGEELPPLSDEEEYLSDSSSSSGVSDTGTDYTQYVRAPRAPRVRPSVAAVSKLGGIDELRSIVSADIARESRAGSKHHSKRAAVGRAKGKTNAAFLTGSKGDSGWD